MKLRQTELLKWASQILLCEAQHLDSICEAVEVNGQTQTLIELRNKRKENVKNSLAVLQMIWGSSNPKEVIEAYGRLYLKTR